MRSASASSEWGCSARNVDAGRTTVHHRRVRHGVETSTRRARAVAGAPGVVTPAAPRPERDGVDAVLVESPGGPVPREAGRRGESRRAVGVLPQKPLAPSQRTPAAHHGRRRGRGRRLVQVGS